MPKSSVLHETETVEEAAGRLGVTPSRVRQLLRGGDLEGFKISPRVWLVRKDSWPREKGFGRLPKWAQKKAAQGD
jgi:hypothetical protein